MTNTLHYIRAQDGDPYQNLALEELLFEQVLPGQVVLYLWQNRRTVVIGRNQNAWRECRVEQLEADGGFLARRCSGGGAVFHDMGNLNFTFAAHDADYNLDRQLEVVTDALAGLGIEATRSGRNDICVDSRKISGNAFQHRDGRSCHHGTLLIDVDMAALGQYLSPSREKMASKGVASVRSRVANLREFAPDLTVDTLCDALEKSFGRVYGLTVEPLTLDSLMGEELTAKTHWFASWQWRLGRPIPFTQEAGGRFDWGEVQLQLAVEGGIIREAGVFSDALATDFIAALPAALKGAIYSSAEVHRIVTDLAAHYQAAQMGQDICSLM